MRMQGTSPDVTPVLTLGYNNSTQMAVWTWSGANPSSWYIVACAQSTLPFPNFAVAAGTARTVHVARGSGSVHIVGSNNGSTPSTPFSACITV